MIKKNFCIDSLCSILNILLPESQPNQNIYKSFDKFLNSINLDNWIVLYIFFELSLIKDLGYDPNLDKFKLTNDSSTDIKKIKIDTFFMKYHHFNFKKNSTKNIQ